MRKGPSPEAAEMEKLLLDSLYASYQKAVAQGRGVKPKRAVPPADRRRGLHPGARRSRKGSSTAFSTARTSRPSSAEVRR